MKLLSFCLTLLLCLPSFAVKSIPLRPIGLGNLLQIKGSIELPKTHQLNKGAPSKIAVYEKDGKDWILAEKINLNDFFSLTDLIFLQTPVHLKSDRSEIKLEISLYHCPSNHKGLCVIDDFEGIAKRDFKKHGSELNLSLIGTDPKKL